MSTETIRFPVLGMTCTSCVNRITRALRHLPGVESVGVDLGHELATVRRDAALASDAVVIEAVARAGYEAHLEAAFVVPDEPRRSSVGRWIARVRL